MIRTHFANHLRAEASNLNTGIEQIGSSVQRSKAERKIAGNQLNSVSDPHPLRPTENQPSTSQQRLRRKCLNTLTGEGPFALEQTGLSGVQVPVFAAAHQPNANALEGHMTRTDRR